MNFLISLEYVWTSIQSGNKKNKNLIMFIYHSSKFWNETWLIDIDSNLAGWKNEEIEVLF